jgi:hypothetical protein
MPEECSYERVTADHPGYIGICRIINRKPLGGSALHGNIHQAWHVTPLRRRYATTARRA